MAAPTCQQKPVELSTICSGNAPCAVRRAVDFDCGNHTIRQADLAVARQGAVFLALVTYDDWAVSLFELDAPRHPQLANRGQGRVFVRADPAGRARVLIATAEGRNALAREVNDDWVVEPLPQTVRVLDFELAPDGTAAVVATRPGDAGSASLAVTDLDGVPGEPGEIIVGSAAWGGYIDLSLGRDATPIVVYGSATATGFVVRRWSGGAPAELATLPGNPDGESNPALEIASATDASNETVLTWSADGGLFRWPRAPVIETKHWTDPRCNGFVTANNPDVCPHDSSPGTDLGEQVVAHTLATTAAGVPWVAAVMGLTTTGCGWFGSCFETLPCDCIQKEEVRIRGARLMVRSLEDPPQATGVTLDRWFPEGSVQAAFDGAGTLYVAVHYDYAKVRLLAIDPSRF
jgi:hypothetical protein